jgi:capsular exopolysaccharide synthesis family protein
MAPNELTDPSETPLPASHHLPAAPVEPFSPGLAGRLDGVEPEEGFDWRRYLATLLRFKWLILALTILGTAAGAAATRYIRLQYQAQATLWIEVGSQRTGPIQQERLLGSRAWIELLRTFEVLEHVVRDQRMYVSPRDSIFSALNLGERFRPGSYQLVASDDGTAWTLSTDDGVVLERALPGDSLGLGLGLKWAPDAEALEPGQQLDFRVTSPRDAAVQLSQRLRAQVGQDGNFMSIELGGTEPDAIERTLNAVIDRYVAFAADLKRERLSELTEILEKQLQAAAENLAASENALESFRVSTITLPSEQASPVAPGLQMTQSGVLGSFFQMRTELDALKEDQEVLRRILGQTADSGLSVAAIEVVPSAASSSELNGLLAILVEKKATLRALRARYTDDHPPVRRLIQEIDDLESVTVPDAVGALLAELDNREVELEARLGSASQDLQQVPPRAIEEARLHRAVAVAGGLYTELEQRFAAAQLAEASSIPDIRVLDRAVAPQTPLGNQASKFVFMAFAASLGFGVAVALLVDRLDPRVRHPEQVVRKLGLPVLGAVPRADGKDVQGTIESMRGIRLNLIHAQNGAGPLVVTVTSPGSGEGKSFVTANLALAFAQAGHRTLLIDGDNRRGRLHRMFDANRKPGLTDVLKSDESGESVVQRTNFDRLSFLGCGTRSHGAPELLGSPAMGRLLNEFRSSYGIVLVDSPPLNAGIDAFAIATLTGNLVLVLRTGVTNQDLTEVKLEVLEGLPVRVLGAVLNDIRPGKSDAYYYGYYSYYLPGYEATDEDGAPAQLLDGDVRG